MDRFDIATRSRVMSRNKSRGTKSTEWRFRSLLMRSGIRGWRIGHNSSLPGRPDIIFFQQRLAIFLDGCFWHGCKRCRSIPAANRQYWLAKIQMNRRRDRKAVRALRSMGWRILRIWEHELKNNSEKVLEKVLVRGQSSPRATR